MGKCIVCGAKISGHDRLCPECEAEYFKSVESEVLGYFICCPFCGSERLQTHLISGGRDTLTCENCGAKWHLYVGLTGFKWAELDIESKNGKGLELLGKRLDKNEWREMAHRIRRTLPRTTPTKVKEEKEVEEKLVKEKEIIKEKEVIVKIRCPYCHNLYDETLDKCPHCGAKR